MPCDELAVEFMINRHIILSSPYMTESVIPICCRRIIFDFEDLVVLVCDETACKDSFRMIGHLEQQEQF